MGLFSKKPVRPEIRSSGIRHHASWPQNGVTFFIKPDGVGWNYDAQPVLMDDSMCEAALAQLEEAYHMNISFPDSEERVMSFWREVSDGELSDSARLGFDWKPPLPGQ